MTAFPEFALDREFRSCVVTRELLQQIEKQLVAAERDLYGESNPVADLRKDVSVFDALGMENFRSAADIPTAGFPETTSAVRLVLESASAPNEPEQRSFKCKLAFRTSHGNYLSVRVRGPQARERAIGLYERIRQLIDSQSLDVWLFRRRDGVTGLLALVAVFVGFVWLAETYALLTSKAPDVERVGYFIRTIVLATSLAYIAVIHFFFPRCAFETTRWAAVQQWRTWAAQGFAGLVVFDVLAFSFGKQIAKYIGLTID